VTTLISLVGNIADAVLPYLPAIVIQIGAAAVPPGAAIAAATDPYWPGQEPCYSVEGVPYYTPDGDPC